ncbi:condensin-2 complex subunit D3-like [Mercenaria mercenaria]|uniref:condensin-2 complex subunit D3-like n=1 Tax=Mercenaria mercenaria TaxID=6596 RepID=UPI00234EA17A|nr:condensin-2 complex subunit D3-like [Mercenaria mercenaria]
MIQMSSARLKMTDGNNIVELLSVIPLNKLSEEWVKSVWESDFTDAENINEEVFLDTDSSTLIETLDSILACLDHWIDDEIDEGLWTLLVESEISLKAVISFLAHLLLVGHKKSADLTQKQIGILAGRTYCKLVLVPGSRAFNIFHPELYEKTADFLKQFITLGSSKTTKRKRSVTPVKSSQAKRNGKSRRKKQSNETSLEDGIEDFGASQNGDDISDDEIQELAPQEISKLRKQLHVLLVDMVTFLEKYSLRQSVSSGYHSVQVLAPLTRHDAEMFDGNFDTSVAMMRQSVPALAFKCLQSLCSQLHGHVGSLMNATCKYLLSNLLMLIGDKSVQTVTKQLQVTRDHAISFICILMKQCGERGLASVRTLLQQMCTKVTDRAEYRAKVAQAVVTIAKEMPNESYSKLIQWFYKLSKHSQINNRGFALEIVSALLATPERIVTDEIPADLRPYTTHRSLLGILLDRCSDKAPTVRARAIGCFAGCLSSRDEGIAGTVKEIVTPVVPGRPNIPRLIKTPGARVPDSVTTVDETSQRSEYTIAQQTVEGSTTAPESTEGGAKDKDTPMHRVHLTPGFDPNLSDSEGVFSMLRRRARDEKVNVRKAALQALEAAVRFEMPNYTKQNIEVLKDHCRDPGLSVRKQALQSLTDLLIDSPKDKFLQSNWLLAALPLVIDRETTLSEKCMETLEELVLNNVVLYHRSKSESHELAWDLLAIIAKPHSVDQRRYLQKTCHHWSRQGKIKPSLITALESHIGTNNNSLILTNEIICLLVTSTFCWIYCFAIPHHKPFRRGIPIYRICLFKICNHFDRYTTTANHYISNIASCLKDPSPLVRKQTLTLITRLLQEDFLKWKGALFYRFISALLDNCEEIQKFGEFCLLHMLIQRHPNMFFQHFMECVFHFNDYREHTVYNKFTQSEKVRELFSLKGDQNSKKRLTLYKFLLENMSDDHRFQLQSKLVQEVLGGIVDGILPVNKDTSDILKDALAILSCKEIKLTSVKVRPNEDVAGDEQEMAAVVVATAKKTIITQVLKKNVIENIVPIVVSLKHMMEKERSPLLKELLMYLRELMKDYKSEVKEILSADRQLATEIEFDLRKFEEQQQEAVRQRNAPASAQGTPIVGVSKSPVPATNLQSPPPSTGNTPRPAGSPRTPALKAGVASPRPGTSKGTPPVLRIAPNRNTPAREAPLSTVAVLNSARQMMSRPRTSSVGTDRADSENEENPATGTTPRRNLRTNRAISTPSVALGNITFHGEANVTFMPPSPISESSSDHRLFDSDSSIGLDKESSDKENEDVLLIKSPLAGAQKARVWNVSSPAPKKRGQVAEDSEEVEPVPLAQISNRETNQSKENNGESHQNEENSTKANENKDNNKKANQDKDNTKTKRRTRLSDQLKDKAAGNEPATELNTRRGKRKLKT